MEKQTKAIHTSFPERDVYGSLAMPVYHVAAYEFDNASIMSDVFCGRIDAPDYSRVTNPTVIYLERKVKALTGAEDVIALTSGMAAISNTMMALADNGKNIVSSRHLFGNTFQLLTITMPRFGAEGRLCDLTDIGQVRKNVDSDTACIFLEIMTNPQMEVADLRELAEVAHEHGIPLVADTTMIPFTQFSAKELGVDIEIVSSTKYISGGATSLGGLIIDYGNFPEFKKRMHKELLFTLGAYMTPHAAYMQTLGLETLEARYRMQVENTLAVATVLREIDSIVSVNYPGLADNRYHDLTIGQFGSAGCMLTIDLADKESCFRMIDGLKLIKRATNLFDNKTLAIHPASTIFGPLSQEIRDSMDVKDTTIRLSIGLEDPRDIVADIRQALENSEQK